MVKIRLNIDRPRVLLPKGMLYDGRLIGDVIQFKAMNYCYYGGLTPERESVRPSALNFSTTVLAAPLTTLVCTDTPISALEIETSC